MAQSRSIIFSFVVVFTMCVFTSIGIAGMKGEVLKESGMQLMVISGKNGISIEAVIYTREGEAQNPTGQLRQFERRQLLVDLQPLHIGPPVFLTFLRNV